MSKPSLFALLWSEEHHHYELHISGQFHAHFGQKDESLWQSWLHKQTSLISFSFQGRAGRLRVVKEARLRGGEYWYAYSTHGRKARKRYLGQIDRLSFTHLEEVALGIAVTKTPPPSSQEPLLAVPNASRARRNGSHIPLLETRLTPPRFSSAFIAREHLQKALDAVQEYRLLLLSAPAGSGKTRLLSAWAAHAPNAIAWLSLDASDNDPARFWTSIIRALRRSSANLANVGSIAQAMLQAPQPPAFSTILTTLINDFVALPREAVLILDDYHVINDQAIHESLLFFVDALPDNLHLVLSSRIDPELPLPRWRVRGQMTEVRDHDLRLTREETATFLGQIMGLALSDTDMGTLFQRTGGWIAGLQLAALSLRKQKDHSAFVQTLSGSHRYLLDYMQQEILADLPLALHDFLLQTAILSRLSASLCQAVTDAPTLRVSQEMLETVERANLFLIPLDDDRQWYRFHDLFREGLLARLRATHPTLISRLHIRAARWYEGQGETREAIVHALAASDFPYAALLMERVVEEVWLHGESQTLYRWIMELPDPVVRDHAHLVLNAALYLLNTAASTVEAQRTSVRAQVEQIAMRVENVFRQHGNATQPSEEASFLKSRLRLLREWSVSLEAIMAGDVKRLRLSTQNMPTVDSEDEVIWQLIPLSNHFILHYIFLREGGVLVPRLLEMKQRASQEGNHYAIIKVTQWLALAAFEAGLLRQAYQECLAAQILLQHIKGYAILAGYFSACQGDVLYQWNRLSEGIALQQRIIQEAAAWQKIDVEITGDLCLAEHTLAERDLVSAHQALQKAEHLIQQEHLDALFATQFTAVRVRYWLATGDIAAASEWATRVVFHPENWDPNRKREFLMLVRVYCAQHQYARAVETLERFRVHFDRPGDFLATSAFLAIAAVALQHEGKYEQSRVVLARLLLMTEPEGFIRVYLEEGEPMRRMLEEFIETATLTGSLAEETLQEISFPYISTLLAAFEGEKNRLALSESARTGRSTQGAMNEKHPASSGLIEPLTPREQEVLQLLAEGASNQSIANRLVISLTTAKKHVSSLLVKLAAENRTHAVARARELSLL
ncbi:LuxR family transcriptional regulator [Ktedonobacteria bacterium brp13]|nr:LuxR family transcriptional regulator [Ktedonobacteria bacterium brp13]